MAVMAMGVQDIASKSRFAALFDFPSKRSFRIQVALLPPLLPLSVMLRILLPCCRADTICQKAALYADGEQFESTNI